MAKKKVSSMRLGVVRSFQRAISAGERLGLGAPGRAGRTRGSSILIGLLRRWPNLLGLDHGAASRQNQEPEQSRNASRLHDDRKRVASGILALPGPGADHNRPDPGGDPGMPGQSITGVSSPRIIESRSGSPT